jgi:UDP-N-acetylmuramate dehydrogenase
MMQSQFPLIFREHVPLAPYTTLGIGGPARFFAEAGTETHVMEALEFARTGSLPLFILGGGSNIVVSDAGFDGLVIRITLLGIRRKRSGLITAAAGEEWDQFVRWCVEHDLAGIECLSGIPGSVGGTPVQNVGAYGQEVSEVIHSVRVLDRGRQKVVELNNEQCGFSYRTSIFNTTKPQGFVVLAVSYELRPGSAPRIVYPDLRRLFAEKTNLPGLIEVRDAVISIRKSKSMVLRCDDPDSKSAGSFFKNPFVSSVTARQAEEAARQRGTLNRDEVMPRYPMPDGTLKLSAAWLIEHAGFVKGYCRGRVGLSSHHALALINRGGATAQELLDLMRDIQEAVRAQFDLELTPEPVFVGFPKPIPKTISVEERS